MLPNFMKVIPGLVLFIHQTLARAEFTNCMDDRWAIRPRRGKIMEREEIAKSILFPKYLPDNLFNCMFIPARKKKDNISKSYLSFLMEYYQLPITNGIRRWGPFSKQTEDAETNLRIKNRRGKPSDVTWKKILWGRDSRRTALSIIILLLMT